MASSDGFVEAVWRRHTAGLSFRELRRAAQAISAVYVEGRGQRPAAAALASDGKRAAFAAYFGTLHFLAVSEIVAGLGAETIQGGTVLDLGCGTGVAGAAWAVACARDVAVLGVERNAWAVREARWTLGALGVRGRVVRGDAVRPRLPQDCNAVVAAYFANELDEQERDRLWATLARAADHGARLLVVEPVARRSAPWWPRWSERISSLGGRSDEWRRPVELPSPVRELDHAAGLDHSLLKARSLYLGR